MSRTLSGLGGDDSPGGVMHVLSKTSSFSEKAFSNSRNITRFDRRSREDGAPDDLHSVAGRGAAFLKTKVVYRSISIALCCSAASAVVQWAVHQGYMKWLEAGSAVMYKDGAWSNVWGLLSFLVSLVISFRTSQAYTRFRDGIMAVNRVQAEWFEAASSVVALCKHSTAPMQDVLTFQHLVVRLFSILFASAMAEIEDEVHNESGVKAIPNSFRFQILDPESVDPHSLLELKECAHKVELVHFWIQGLIVEHLKSGVMTAPPPILSRVFQEMSNGMVALETAMSISRIPFPLAYSRVCYSLLLVVSAISVFFTHHWVNGWAGAVLFTFIQVFALWSLNFTAIELENPFGSDDHDIDLEFVQRQMDARLRLIVRPGSLRTPQLFAAGCESSAASSAASSIRRRETLDEAFTKAKKLLAAEGALGGASNLCSVLEEVLEDGSLNGSATPAAGGEGDRPRAKETSLVPRDAEAVAVRADAPRGPDRPSDAPSPVRTPKSVSVMEVHTLMPTSTEEPSESVSDGLPGERRECGQVVALSGQMPSKISSGQQLSSTRPTSPSWRTMTEV